MSNVINTANAARAIAALSPLSPDGEARLLAGDPVALEEERVVREEADRIVERIAHVALGSFAHARDRHLYDTRSPRGDSDAERSLVADIVRGMPNLNHIEDHFERVGAAGRYVFERYAASACAIDRGPWDSLHKHVRFCYENMGAAIHNMRYGHA